MGAKEGPRAPGWWVTSWIGLLACATILAGYFLPWTALSPAVEEGLRLSETDVAREAASIGARKDGERHPARRLADGIRLTGNEWAGVLDEFGQSRDLDENQRRALAAAHAGVRALPFAAALLALLLLLHAIPPRKAMRPGLGPIAAVLTVAHFRYVAALLLTVVMAMGLVVGAIALLLWTAAPDPGRGIQLMAAGGAVAFLSQVLGYGPGRLRALLFVILLVVALAIAYAVFGR